MGAWYWIGVAAGLGVAAGVLIAGSLRAAAAAGGAAGGIGAAQVVRGALRRGGTRGGTALIVAGAALAVAALAWVPALGYLEAVALPAIAARLRRRSPETYAGLRTLAKD